MWYKVCVCGIREIEYHCRFCFLMNLMRNYSKLKGASAGVPMFSLLFITPHYTCASKGLYM